MAVTTTHSTPLLLRNLRRDYPALWLKEADTFYWSATEQTVFFDTSEPEWQAFLLHELAHGILGHSQYRRDIQLLGFERDAWAHAADTLSRTYGVPISDEIAQANLDTYRDWLHSRSTCPQCQATGIQSHTEQYKCLGCHTTWRVNEARTCALRRHIV